MSDRPVIRAVMHRAEKWIECNGIRATPDRGGDFEYSICMALHAAGQPDATIQFYDERDIHCSTIPSVHAAARRIGHLYADVVPTTLYVGLRHVQVNAWKQVHVRTRKAMIDRELIILTGDQATLTATGLAEIAKYEALYGAQTVAPPEPVEDKPKRTLLTDSQVEAFEIIKKRPHRWEEISVRTRAAMISRDWITFRNDDPIITEIGRAVYKTHLAEINKSDYTKEIHKKVA